MDTYWNGLLCGVERWNTIWGDPWLSGSIMVIGYGLAAYLALWMLRGSGQRFWAWVSGFCVFMTINTPLDLHALPPSIGRCLAKSQGWYEDRMIVSNLVITLAVFVALWFLYAVIRSMQPLTLPKLLVAASVVVVALWTMLESSEAHWIGVIGRQSIGGITLSDLIEFAAITLLIGALGLAVVRHRRRRPLLLTWRP